MCRRPLLFLLLAGLLGASCTDRMAPSDDRWGRGGALIAMSGGEGGARYACVSCHGARGEGNGFDAPRLAGLPAGYLQKQLEDYAAGLRAHALMRDVARFLDSHERVQVARYYAALPPRALPAVTTPAADASTAALYARFVSRQDDSPTMKAVAAMRNQFGGHAVRTAAPKGGDASGEQGGPDQSGAAEQAGAGSGNEPAES